MRPKLRMIKVRILRGAHEIGGSCVELVSEDSRVVLDIGMPLVEQDGAPFDMKRYQQLPGPELVARGVLPECAGLYHWDNDHPRVNGLLISHAHMDHYGFLPYVHPDVPVYLSEGSRKLIENHGHIHGQTFHHQLMRKSSMQANRFDAAGFTSRPIWTITAHSMHTLS